MFDQYAFDLYVRLACFPLWINMNFFWRICFQIDGNFQPIIATNAKKAFRPIVISMNVSITFTTFAVRFA